MYVFEMNIFLTIPGLRRTNSDTGIYYTIVLRHSKEYNGSELFLNFSMFNWADISFLLHA